MAAGLPEPEPLRALIDALRGLPGVGVRTARRMAYHLLQHDPDGALRLGDALRDAVGGLCHCERCNSFSQTPIRPCCASSRRRPTRT